MESLTQFAREIRHILKEYRSSGHGYIDLSAGVPVTRSELIDEQGLPEEDPLAASFFLILDALRDYRIDLAQIGINEIWKAYLRWIDGESQEELSRQLAYRIKLIHTYCLEDGFPFGAQVWEYMTRVLATVCDHLLRRKLIPACQILLKTTGEMGRQAARKGLHTSSTQHFLRSLELHARQLGEEALADSARNQRFNLEVF